MFYDLYRIEYIANWRVLVTGRAVHLAVLYKTFVTSIDVRCAMMVGDFRFAFDWVWILVETVVVIF